MCLDTGFVVNVAAILLALLMRHSCSGGTAGIFIFITILNDANALAPFGWYMSGSHRTSIGIEIGTGLIC